MDKDQNEALYAVARAYMREHLEEGTLIQYVGVHLLKYEQWVKEYGIPPWEYAFVTEQALEERI